MSLLQNIFEGMSVPTAVATKVQQELPCLAFEKALMLLAKHGASRQEGHAKVRQVTLSFKDRIGDIDLAEAMKDPYFNKVFCQYCILLYILYLSGARRCARSRQAAAQLHGIVRSTSSRLPQTRIRAGCWTLREECKQREV